MNVSKASSAAGATYDVAVAQKQQQSVRQQGEQAVKLIDAAGGASAPAVAHGSVGHNLNVTA